MNNRGKLVVIDGLDGTGKATQRAMLGNYMFNEGALVIDNLKTPFPLSYLAITKPPSISELTDIKGIKERYQFLEFQIDPNVLNLFREIKVKWYKSHEI